MRVKIQEGAETSRLLPYFATNDLVLAQCEVGTRIPWPAVVRQYEGMTLNDEMAYSLDYVGLHERVNLEERLLTPFTVLKSKRVQQDNPNNFPLRRALYLTNQALERQKRESLLSSKRARRFTRIYESQKAETFNWDREKGAIPSKPTPGKSAEKMVDEQAVSLNFELSQRQITQSRLRQDKETLSLAVCCEQVGQSLQISTTFRHGTIYCVQEPTVVPVSMTKKNSYSRVE